MYFYTYKITFVDGYYYFGSRKSKVKPKDDIYWGSPKTHKDKWKTTMFFKTIINVYETSELCCDAEVKLIKIIYKTDPLCLNENCVGNINYTLEVRQKMSQVKIGKPMSEETKQKISKTKKGKSLSEETKQKIRQKRSLQIFNEEHRKKMSDSKKEFHRKMRQKNEYSSKLAKE